MKAKGILPAGQRTDMLLASWDYNCPEPVRGGKIEGEEERTHDIKDSQSALLPTDEFNRVIIPVKRGEENTDYVNASFIDVSAVCVPGAPNTPWGVIWALHSPHPPDVGKVTFESIISSELIPTYICQVPES